MSSSLFEYSKEYHYDGCPVSLGLKKASKMANESNDSIPTLSNRLSSLSSIAKVDHSPTPGFLCSMIESGIVLWSKFQAGETEMTALLLNPRILGGYPISQYHNFLYWGDLDPLTSAIRQVIVCEAVDRPVYWILNKLIDLRRSSYTDYTMLVKDPFSLNITVPLQAENMRCNRLPSVLPDVVKNKNLKPLFEMIKDGAEVDI